MSSKSSSSVSENTENLKQKIFVGNISYRVKRHQLQNFFQKFGKVKKAFIAHDHLKGWSKGFGFVEFHSTEGVDKALAATEEELYLDQRLMRISRAHPSWKDDLTVNDFPIGVFEIDGKTEESCSSLLSSSSCDADHIVGECLIHHLPNEILIEIFSFLNVRQLTRMERVCKRWREAAHTRFKLLRNLHFHDVFHTFGEGLTSRILSSVLQKIQGQLVELDLSGCNNLDFKTPVVIGHFCPSLEILNLDGLRQVTDKGVTALGQGCPRLVSLILSGCYRLTDSGLSKLFSSIPCLRKIDLSSCSLVGRSLGRLSSSLHELNLDDCKLLRPESLNRLAAACPQLRLLSISRCSRLEGCCAPVITTMLELQVLRWRDCPSLATLTATPPQSALVHLDLAESRGVDDADVVQVAAAFPSLRRLNLSLCRSISDLTPLSSLIHLRELDASYMDQVDSAALVDMACALPVLERLSLIGCSVDSNDVARFSGRPLKFLDLSHCPLVDNDGVLALARQHDPQRHLEVVVGGTAVDAESLSKDLEIAASYLQFQTYTNCIKSDAMLISLVSNAVLSYLRFDQRFIIDDYDWWDEDDFESDEDYWVDDDDDMIEQHLDLYDEELEACQ